MEIEITVPVIGESITEATVSSLLVSNGTIVVSGQELMELETDKVNQALYAPQDGEVSFLVSVGETVKVGQKVATLNPDIKAVVKPLEKPKKQEKKAEEKYLHRENLEEISPNRKKMTALRKTIAAKLVEVKNTTAMLTTFNEVDMTAVMDVRAREKDRFFEAHGVKLGFMSFFVKATVEALKAYPIIHSKIEGDEIVTPGRYDMGIAVSTEKGLVVPVIKECDKLTLAEIEQQIADQAKKAREGKTSIDDLRGGSFTITNGGVFGSMLSTPIINPSQSAILGMHAIMKRPVVIQDQIEIRSMMYLALSYDHRLIDGKDAVLFLVHLKQMLEDPSKFKF